MPKKGEIKNRVGEKYITNEGYEIEIIDYFNFIRECILTERERGVQMDQTGSSSWLFAHKVVQYR